MKSRALAAVAAGLCVAGGFRGRRPGGHVQRPHRVLQLPDRPAGLVGDIFSMNADGTDLRQLTDNPLDDAQSDWSPDGRDIAYRIRKPETPQ